MLPTPVNVTDRKAATPLPMGGLSRAFLAQDCEAASAAGMHGHSPSSQAPMDGRCDRMASAADAGVNVPPFSGRAAYFFDESAALPRPRGHRPANGRRPRQAPWSVPTTLSLLAPTPQVGGLYLALAALARTQSGPSHG